MTESDTPEVTAAQELAATRARIAELEEVLMACQQKIKALEQDRFLFKSILDLSPDHIFIKDRESRFIVTNKAHCRDLFGIADPAEIIGKSDFDLFPADEAQKYYAEEQAIMESQQPVVGREWTAPSSDGHLTWLSEHKLPMVNEEGKVIGLVGFAREITRRKEAELALEKAYAEIEAQVEVRTAELEHEIAERQRMEEERVQMQEQVIQAQQRAIKELSTPIIPVLDNIIVMTVVGSIDTMRARDITRALLAGIREHQAKIVLLDITGVAVVDSGVAAHLHKTIQAAQLKGARAIITGISSAVAETVVDLGIDWSQLTTLASLQDGLQAALHMLGRKIV